MKRRYMKTAANSSEGGESPSNNQKASHRHASAPSDILAVPSLVIVGSRLTPFSGPATT
jgi:hypothetical protein